MLCINLYIITATILYTWNTQCKLLKSLVYKWAMLNDVHHVMYKSLYHHCNHPIHIAILTETWLFENIPSDPFTVDGYVLLRKDRDKKRGGGVCIYIKQDLPFKQWSNLESDIESIWITVWPKLMPRDTPCITIAGVYYPPGADNWSLGDHLNKGIDSISCKHPTSGFMVLGDFNSFPDWYMTKFHSFAQLVKSPTRKKQSWINVLQIFGDSTKTQRFYHTLANQTTTHLYVNQNTI